MKLRFTALLATLLVGFAVQAQTADEILEKYFENTGGKANWEVLKGMKMEGKVSVQSMEFPLSSIQLKDGRQATSFSVQGMTFYQGVYDGTTLWGTNQMTMKAEKSDAETTENFKANLGGDFPSPFLNYKSKGFKVELLGKESIDGTETFKLKLTKKPIKVDGQETENVEFYYFDAEDYVPILMEAEAKSGPTKGMTSQVKMSDYQEVNGLLVPYSTIISYKGTPGDQTLKLTSVEFDPKVEATVFVFPSGN